MVIKAEALFRWLIGVLPTSRYDEVVQKTVQVFNTLEEADSADALARAKMPPQERVDICCELRERAHADAFKHGSERVYRVLELERS
jgi:hypothetical protein